jgi:phytoene dehydrogenase-like protein
VKRSFDAIVVGGGHNALVASWYLAAAGMSVLVLERRRQPGGLTGPIEFFPGYRGAITNSPGSLEPKIAVDMRLPEFGLRFVKPDPSLVMPFPGGRRFVGWRDPRRTDLEFCKFSENDGAAYHAIIAFFHDFARRLRISIFDPPPPLSALLAALRTSDDEMDFASIVFGSIKDFLDARLESEEIKALLGMLSLAGGSVGPRTPGTPLALLQRPLSLASTTVTAEHDPRTQPLRGSTGLPIGGMGSVGLAMAASARAQGVTILTESDVKTVLVDDAGRVRGVALASGDEFAAPVVLSNLNPKLTLLRMVEERHLPGGLVAALRALDVAGSAFKLVLALGDLPRYTGAPRDEHEQLASCQFRVAPSLDYLERGYDDLKYGRVTTYPQLWGLTPTVMDPSMAPPGKHLMSVNVWYAPYHLAEGGWDASGELLARRCICVLSEYFENIPDIIEQVRWYTPIDLEREFGMHEGNHLQVDMTPRHMFGLRPLPQLSQYRTPIGGLYLCGAGMWPGGYVSGVPGHNASQQVLRDAATGRSGRATNGPARTAKAADRL